VLPRPLLLPVAMTAVGDPAGEVRDEIVPHLNHVTLADSLLIFRDSLELIVSIFF
jgi:hypothetical protein